MRFSTFQTMLNSSSLKYEKNESNVLKYDKVYTKTAAEIFKAI